jgi:hypothetical protein
MTDTEKQDECFRLLGGMIGVLCGEFGVPVVFRAVWELAESSESWSALAHNLPKIKAHLEAAAKKRESGGDSSG